MSLSRKAVKKALICRTKENKGYGATIHVRIYDNGLWNINGEVCVDPFDANGAVTDVLYALNNLHKRHEDRTAA